MPKVLVVTNDFAPRAGGIEVFVEALCARFPADQVVVYTADWPGAAEHDATLPYPVVRSRRRILLASPRVARDAVQVLREHGCDRVLFGASAPLGLLARPLRRAGARRIVALSHGHEVWWARVPVVRRLMRRIGDDVDVLTYVSEWCGDQIARALSPAARSRMRRLAPGVNSAEFRPGVGGDELRAQLGLAPTTPVVVCGGRLVRRKGQDRLIDAWPAVRAAVPDARLLLVGSGPYGRSLRRRARRLGVAEAVTFAGAVPAIAPWFDAADVFAMPSRSRLGGLEVEGLGIVFLEAASCGKPVVAGDSGGIPDAVVDGVTGHLVDPRSPAEIADRIVALLTDPARAATMGRAGRDRVEADWQWRDVARAAMALLEMTATPLGTTERQEGTA